MQNNQYLNLSDSQIVDPVVKLLEDIRIKKTKIIIPNEEDIIPSLWNDRTIKKTVSTEVKIGDNSLTFEKPSKLSNLFQNYRSPNFPTKQQKIILNKLENVPAYVVVTDNKEMVMATPRDLQEQTFLEWIYKKYHNLFIWKEDNGPISLALFFLNKEDANLYLQEIGKNDPKCAEKTKLRVQLTSLANFYKLNRISHPGTQAKLIADLEEIFKITSQYIPKDLHEINPKQKYTDNLYQGNPIYLLKTSLAKKDSEKKLVDYKIPAFEESSCIKSVFFKLEDAYLAWNKFCENNKQIKLPLIPEIEIYNLENYLLDLEKSTPETVKTNYFIATQSSFDDLDKELKVELNKIDVPMSRKFKKVIRIHTKKLVSFYKGIVWVFTSDTLPTEDNSW
jgi:hypothetical protein